MEVVCIKGQVVKLPRVLREKNPMKLMVFDAQEQKEVSVVLGALPGPNIRRGSVVTVRGYWRDPGKVFYTPGGSEIKPEINKDDIVILLKHHLPNLDYNDIMIRLKYPSLLDLIWNLLENEEARKKVSEIVGKENVEKVIGIVTGWLINTDLACLTDLLSEAVNLDIPDIIRVYDFLEHRAAKKQTTVTELLRHEPYMLAEVEGMRLKEADALVRYLRGNVPKDASRAFGVFRHIIWRHVRNGDSYATYSQIVNEAGQYGVPFETVYALLWKKDEEKDNRGIVSDAKEPTKTIAGVLLASEEKGLPFASMTADDAKEKIGLAKSVYFSGVFHAERKAAEKLCELLDAPLILLGSKKLLAEAKAVSKNPLSPEQVEAIQRVARNTLTIVTGAAGTGKSELTATLVAALLNLGLRVAVAAPTGIAAQRLSKKVLALAPQKQEQMRSGTLHLLLSITKEMQDYPEPLIREQNESGYDVWVVDEAAMMDVYLFCELLHTLKEGARLVLVGDPNQLGAPGPGRVLEDLVEACKNGWLKNTAHVELTKVHRASAMVEAAHGILKGKFPQQATEKMSIIRAKTGQEAIDNVRRLVLDLIAAGVAPEDILVLSPFKTVRDDKVNKVSAYELNFSLQQALNPNGVQITNAPFRVGDRVINTENDYREIGKNRMREIVSRRDVFNGETGVVVNVNDMRNIAEVRYFGAEENVQPYTSNEMVRYLDLAYALTVHKAQGGESPVVIFVCMGTDKNLVNRRIFYTAVTRCKYDERKPHSEKLFLVMPESSEEYNTIKNMLLEEPARRHSKLAARIAAMRGVTVSTPAKDDGYFSPPPEDGAAPMAAKGK